MAPIGTLTANNQRQWVIARIAAATVGPIAAATATAKALIPMARPNIRCGYVKRTNAEFTLMIPAAPRPCTTRAILRVPRVGARAHASDAAVNTPMPQCDTRR